MEDVTLASSDPITLATYLSVDGQFGSVTFVDAKGGTCEGKADYLTTALQVTMQCPPPPNTPAVPVGAIVGGVVGGVVFLALVALLICYLVPSLREKVFPFKSRKVVPSAADSLQSAQSATTTPSSTQPSGWQSVHSPNV